MSPDGSMVAWIETIPPGAAAVFVKDLRDTSATARTVMEGESAQGLAWSRDGKLAFIANTEAEKQLQLYVVEKPARGKPRKVTNLEGYLADPHWSPDGKSIAMLRIEGVTRVPGPTEATAPETGVMASQTPAAAGDRESGDGCSPRHLTGGMYVYEFDWSPDSKNLAYLAAPGDGDDNWYIAGAVRHRRGVGRGAAYSRSRPCRWRMCAGRRMARRSHLSAA